MQNMYFAKQTHKALPNLPVYSYCAQLLAKVLQQTGQKNVQVLLNTSLKSNPVIKQCKLEKEAARLDSLIVKNEPATVPIVPVLIQISLTKCVT